jgi:hypothetical protein
VNRVEHVAARRITPRVRLGAIAALALAAAFGVWHVTRPSSQPSAEQTVAPTPARGARTVSIANLLSVAAKDSYPVYWAGSRPRMRYELTEASGGRVYIRYLPAHVRAGDPRARLTIGTYPVQDAYAQVQAAARRPGAVVFHLTGGTIAVYNKSRPTNVYLATPGSPVQVEVYHPTPNTARKLVLEKQIVPVG